MWSTVDLVRTIHPSSKLVQSLSSVLQATETLSVSDSVSIAEENFRAFVVEFLHGVDLDNRNAATIGDVQVFVDIFFLARVAMLWQDRWEILSSSLEEKKALIQSRVRLFYSISTIRLSDTPPVTDLATIQGHYLWSGEERISLSDSHADRLRTPAPTRNAGRNLEGKER